MEFAAKDNHVPTLDEKLAWLRLARTENVGPITFYNFIKFYGSAEKAIGAIPELSKRGGRKKPLRIPAIDSVKYEYDALVKKGGDIITAAENDYPLALAALEDAPPVIAVIGNKALMHKPCMGIVGARNASLNGRKFAGTLARALGEAGQVIVSGMARGIDTAAHQGALDTGTIAVLAGGIDIVYPPENQNLYDAIKEKGLLIAESPLGSAPRARDFPRRNRIVSGLSQGIAVIEATERSGSLITARLAGEQGRDVYAVPGHPHDPRAAGPNKLIRDGATLIRNAADILEGLENFSGGLLKDSAAGTFDFAQDNRPAPAQPDPHTLDDAREQLAAHISYTPVSIDELIRETGIGAATAQTLLLELELAGTVQRLPGNRILRLEE